MPLTSKGETIKEHLQEEYGSEKGERVLYAGKNKGTFTGIDEVMGAMKEITDSVEQLHRRADALDAAFAEQPAQTDNLRGKGRKDEFHEQPAQTKNTSSGPG